MRNQGCEIRGIGVCSLQGMPATKGEILRLIFSATVAIRADYTLQINKANFREGRAKPQETVS